MLKILLVVMTTACSVFAADYLYKLTAPETAQGDEGELFFAAASIPPNCTTNPWTGNCN